MHLRPLTGLCLGLSLIAVPVDAASGHASTHVRRPASATPAHFRVGAAVVTINPRVTTYAGGFGASPPIGRGRVVGNPLSVRALYVSNGRHAVEMAVVDSQAEFAAYQEGGQFGITAARIAAATAIDNRHRGPHIAPADIIIQATHSHSAPTLEGLWGPVPSSYLRTVTRAEETALETAAQRARPAAIDIGTANAAALDDVEVAQYDTFPGWAGDPLLTVLRAVDPTNDATIATYATVPAHPDIVCGACLGRETADYQGVVRARLQRELGGVALVGPATLGREETPVQATSLADDQIFSRQVKTLIYTALRTAHPLTSNEIDGVQRFVHIPGTGAALLALVEANHLPSTQKAAIAQTTGEYPIDRADTPPYQNGGVIGTWVTGLRIGNIAFLSMPGEPFPEIRQSLATATKDALVVALSKGQDDLGYFYPSYVTPMTETYPSDTLTNSASASTGDVVMAAQGANLRTLGFATATVLPTPASVDAAQTARPGLQVIGGPFVGDAGGDGQLHVSLLPVFSPPDLPEGTLDYGLPVGGAPLAYSPAGSVQWTFGDASTGASGYHVFGGTDRSPTTIVHEFSSGTYQVRATIADGTGQPAVATFPVTVYPALHVSIRLRRVGSWLKLRPHVTGGDGRVLALRWLFSDGARAAGRDVRHRADGERVTLTVTDGTGTRATTATQLPAS